MTTPAPWGNPFGVSTTAGNQMYMKTAAFADGSFVAVWVDTSNTGSDTSVSAICGQLFNADGSKRGSEFVVNTTTEGEQTNPTVAVLSDGRFVVAWKDDGEVEDEDGSGIRARIFNADGTAFNRGGEGGTSDFLVNTTSQAGDQSQPSIAALANGGFVIAFMDQDEGAIRAQVFDARGQHSGLEATVNTDADDAYGAFSIVGTGDHYTVFYGSFPGSESMIVRGRTLYTDGRAPSDAFTVSNPGLSAQLPSTTKLADGKILVTWVSQATLGDMESLSNKAQIYNADGSKFGGEISLKVPGLPVQIAMDVTALPGGGFAVALLTSTETKLTGTSKLDVGVIFFDANGNQTGFKTNITQVPLIGIELGIDISTLADGRVVLTSTLPLLEGEEGYNVFGQIVDGRAAGVSVPGSAGNDDYYGSAFNDTLNGAGGNDTLRGDAGDDILNGGAGIDTMIGGLGNDIYYVDNVGDQVTELAGGGTDTVFSAISYALSAELEHLLGSGSGALRLTGNAGANTITGADGKDRLDGGLGNDTLGGGYGNDVLIGGKGKDVFVFAAKLGTDKTDRKVNFDTISDFKLKEDKIHLDKAIFSKLKKTGKLSKAFFSIDKANDKNDHIIYSKDKGVLSYDPDGSGAKKAIEFAKVKAKLNLSAGDFIVI
ncbi:hypothetical protein [Microvirga sp. P5_D2]